MRNKNNKHIGIEIDPELHYKLHYISKYYGRSANGEILYLIRQEIKAFEKTEGEIEIPQAQKTNWGCFADGKKDREFFVLCPFFLASDDLMKDTKAMIVFLSFSEICWQIKKSMLKYICHTIKYFLAFSGNYPW